MANENPTGASDNPTQPTGNLPDSRDPSTKPLTEKQQESKRYACRDSGMVDCDHEFDSVDMDEVRDALQAHYIDAHPGHRVDDAYMLTLADRNRM